MAVWAVLLHVFDSWDDLYCITLHTALRNVYMVEQTPPLEILSSTYVKYVASA